MDSFRLKNQRVKYDFPVGYVQEHLTVINGLDRVDNSIGYIESNVVPCCYICNKMKGELPVEDFLRHLNNIFTRIA